MHILSLFTAGNFDARECVTTTEGQQKDFSLTTQLCEYIFSASLILSTIDMQTMCCTVIGIIKIVQILSGLI